MATKRVLTDIPGDEVNQVVEDFKSEGCTASKQKQDNGLWTVTADCPESN